MAYSANLRTIHQTATDPVVVVEFYPADQTPDATDGFDPADAVKRYAPVSGVTFAGETYTRLVSGYGSAKKTITGEINSFSVTLSNLTNEAATYELTSGFEGLILVLRYLSRSQSASVADSQILWVGRCERPKSGTREKLTIPAKHVVGSLDVSIPRRKFTPDDDAGRHFADPLFEGFRYIPRYSTLTYTTRERRGGLLGLFGMKKTVTHTLQYSSYSDLDHDRSVPEMLGRVQMPSIHIGYFDLGSFLLTITAFGEGEILGYDNTRSEVPGFYLGGQVKRYGELGGVGAQIPNPDTRFDGWGNGYYSRLAYCYFAVNGSDVATVDPAPLIASVIIAKIITVPDASGDWVTSAWSDNGTAQAYWALTSPDYYKLAAAWFDEPAATESFDYNNELIFDQSWSDIIFTPDSAIFTDNNGLAPLYPSTALATPEYFKYLNGDATEVETFLLDAPKKDWTFPTEPGENSIDPTDFPTNGTGTGTVTAQSLDFFLRRRYTSNVALTEEMPVIDFLNNILFPASRLYLSQNDKGQIKINNKKPADWALLAAAAAQTDTDIDVDDVAPWQASVAGLLLIDPHTSSSEIREVNSAAYDTAQNSVTLTASGNITVGGFSGCDGASTPATATLTVDTAATTNTFTLEGIQIDFTKGSNDTVKTIAGFIYGTINGHPTLQRRFSAAWDPNTAVVTITAKFGTLTLATAIDLAHPAPLTDPTTAPTLTPGSGGALAAGDYKVAYSYVTSRGETLISSVQTATVTAGQKITVSAITPPAGADSVNWYCSPATDSFKMRLRLNNDGSSFEIDKDDLPALYAQIPSSVNRSGTEAIRIQQAFTDAANTRAKLTRSNVLKGTYEWILGNREKPINRVDLKIRDSTQDYRLVELRISDPVHQAQVNKVNKVTVNGQAIDNYNQGYRIANGILAEYRDADFFYRWSSDREACLLEEGDVVAITDSGSGVVNLPVRIEEITFSDLIGGFVSPNFLARKYATTLYDDSVAERDIPVFIPGDQTTAEIELELSEMPLNLTHAMSGSTWNDNAIIAGTLEVNLPTQAPRLVYSFRVSKGFSFGGIAINATNGTSIKIGDTETTSDGLIYSDVVGSYVRIECPQNTDGQWIATIVEGEWVVDKT